MNEFPIYIDVELPDDPDGWAKLWLTRNPGGVTAVSYMQAPGKGDQIMGTVQQALVDQSLELGEPVIHIIQATNKGQLLLPKGQDINIWGMIQKQEITFTKKFTQR